jgi:hypothetical protein
MAPLPLSIRWSTSRVGWPNLSEYRSGVSTPGACCASVVVVSAGSCCTAQSSSDSLRLPAITRPLRSTTKKDS